jgi:Protein of unknown function (DUF2530)
MSDKRHLVRPPAVEVHARRVVLIGTAMWFVAFVALAPFYVWLGQHDHRDWLWTCLAGWLLGLCGAALMNKHRDDGRVT